MHGPQYFLNTCITSNGVTAGVFMEVDGLILCFADLSTLARSSGNYKRHSFHELVTRNDILT
jgi:hypothetical protein